MGEALADVHSGTEEVAAAGEEKRRENRLSVGSLDKHMGLGEELADVQDDEEEDAVAAEEGRGENRLSIGFTGSRSSLQLKAHSGDIAPLSPQGAEASTGCPPTPSGSFTSLSTRPTTGRSRSFERSVAVANHLYDSGKRVGDELRLRIVRCQKCCLSMAEVALLVPKEAIVSVPISIQTTLEGSVKYYGDDFRLLVLKLSPENFRDNNLAVVPAEQLARLQAELQGLVEQSPSTHFLWPLHRQCVGDAVVARMAQLVTESSLQQSQEAVDTESGGRQSSQAGRWLRSFRRLRQWSQRVLAWLCIWPPAKDGDFLKIIEEQYGNDTAFCFQWGAWYAQQLWLLVLLVVVSLILQVEPVGGNILDRQRLLFESFKVLVWLWSMKVAWQGQKFKPKPSRSTALICTKRTSYIPVTGCWQKTKLWLKLIGIAGPLLIMFYVGVIFLLVGYTMLILHVIYEWGDCIHLHRPETPCRDPQVKFGVLGWLVEVTCDVVLAIIFELLYLAGQFLAERIAHLRNYEFQSDHVCFVGKWTVALSVLDRIGFAFTLAFLYVPQWESPSPVFGLETVDPTRDCSDLLFGDSSYLCLQRRLPVQSRRWVFRKLMKGPFCVAPFVQLAMTVLVPLAARCIDNCFHNKKRQLFYRICWPLRGLSRILSLIFTYECDSTGNLRYVVQGEPFKELKLVNPDTASSPQPQLALSEGCNDEEEQNGVDATTSSMRLLQDALSQVKNKPFETYDELLNEKMSLLWVLFFAPVLGYGVIFTLFARIVRMKFLIPKLLYIRRRSFPADDAVGRKTQVVFTWAACFASFGWSFALSIITYNDDLHKEAFGCTFLTGLLVVWLGAAVVMLFHCHIP